MIIALKEYLQADTAITALVPSNRIRAEKVDQTDHFPKIVIKLIGSGRRDASMKKVATHQTQVFQIDCQGGYDLTGTQSNLTSAINVAKAVEDRLETLHNTLGTIGSTETAQVKGMAVTDARISAVELDPTTKPTMPPIESLIRINWLSLSRMDIR